MEWIGLAFIGFVILCGLFGLWQLSKPYNISTEEFERRAQQGPGSIGAALIGLQKALDPALQKAVEAQEDLRQGRYDGEQGSGEPPEAGSAEDENSEREKPNA